MFRRIPTLILLCIFGGCSGFDTSTMAPRTSSPVDRDDEDLSDDDTPLAEVLFIPMDKPRVIFRINTEDELKKLVLEPLDASVINPNPARYEILGELTVNYKERQLTVVLFSPWGHYQDGDAYRIADFSKLGRKMTADLAICLDAIKPD